MPSKKPKASMTVNQKSKGNQQAAFTQGSNQSEKSVNPSSVKSVRRRSLSSVSSISSDELSDIGSKRAKGPVYKGQRINRSPLSRGRHLYNR